MWLQVRDLYLYLFRHAIIVNGYVDDHTWCGIRHRNWGDDLNFYFLQKLTGCPIIIRHNFRMAKWLQHRNFLCIGTLLDGSKYKDCKTTIWGSGCSGADRGLTYPEKVLAVRGPKSRSYLLSQGIECPEVYGDPALLLPLVYQPKGDSPSALPSREGTFSEDRSSALGSKGRFLSVAGKELETKKYRLGIIPHVVDLHHPVIEDIRKKYADEILIIDLANYKKWTDVIDQICSCERILSSSLHGLITSDAYQVPNCWIELSGKISGGYFKFHDYASSVKRDFNEPSRIEKTADVAYLANHAALYFSCADAEIVKELQQGLIKVAPFRLRI